MADLVDTLSKVGAFKDKLLLGAKNLTAPDGPGKAAPALGKDASGDPVRYNKDGSPPTPVANIGEGNFKVIPVK